MSEKSNEQPTKETLKWIHIAISDEKRSFVGNYHKIKKNTCNYTLMNLSTSLIVDTLESESLKDLL